jgi:hypothetical protein
MIGFLGSSVLRFKEQRTFLTEEPNNRTTEELAKRAALAICLEELNALKSYRLRRRR